MVTNIEESARRALAFTAQMVTELGPRPSGSEKSRLAADPLRRQASRFADSAFTEDYPVHPKAILVWIRILVSLY